MTGPGRREFLAALACIWVSPGVRALPPGEQAALAVGRAYLQQRPEMNDAARLRRLLPAEPPDHPERWLADRIREDFAEGRTEIVSGWQLSRTEAVICALQVLE